MKYQIIPNLSIDNTKLIGLLENTNYYRKPFDRLKYYKKEDYLEFEYQYTNTYEMLMNKDNVKFFIGIDDRVKENFETKLNICWKHATFKEANFVFIGKETKELELVEHHFLSLKTDMRGQFPLSNLLETQNILKDDEEICIRLELQPQSPTWYKEADECINKFKLNNQVTTKNKVDVKAIGSKVVNLAFDAIYTGRDFINYMVSDEEIKHEYPSDSRYANLIRHGLSHDTLQKTKYNAYNTKIIISMNSNRSEVLYRNILRSFNSMAGDNSFILVNKSSYKNILSSKELTQIMQLPTKEYQNTYKINNIDTKEIDIPRELQNGKVRIGFVDYRGKRTMATWSEDKNIMSLAKVFVGGQNAGKTTAIKRTVKDCYHAGYSNIVIDYIEDCEIAREVSKSIPSKDRIVIELGKRDLIPALAYNEVSKLITEDMDNWERIRLANLLAEQVEYLINAITDSSTGELTAPMLRYLHSACMVTFIRPEAKINDVFDILRRWDKRNEAIRYAKYSNCFDTDDDIFFDLEELHRRDKDGKIVGTREDLIIGIINRITLLRKNPYIKAMLQADIDKSQDFTKFIEEGKSIFVMIPQNMFPNPMIRDVLTTYFISRIWLTVQMRKDNKNARLCNVIMDEVHQVPTTARFLSSHVTEFRRHRLGLILSCHYLKQFRGLLEALKSSGASYVFIAGTEKENFEALREELDPFIVEDGLLLKPYTSLNIVNYGNQYAKFITALPKT
ncbi:hypothetical protein AAK964_08590 [Tissierella praeacuta]|uniref:hypothetical protein n=1 Tax=Tissierella praeacuta TaxID=43131 RepID=UPI00351803C7